MKNIIKYIEEGFYQNTHATNAVAKLLILGFEQIGEYENMPCFYMDYKKPISFDCELDPQEYDDGDPDIYCKFNHPEIYLIPAPEWPRESYHMIIKDRNGDQAFMYYINIKKPFRATKDIINAFSYFAGFADFNKNTVLDGWDYFDEMIAAECATIPSFENIESNITDFVMKVVSIDYRDLN